MAKIIADRRVTSSSIDGQLKRIKDNVKDSYDSFKSNYDMYNSMRRFVFKSSLTDDDINFYQERNLPQVEFNILEAYISRQRGEFSKQEPSLSVSSADGAKNVNPELLEFVENHIRSIFSDANKDNLEYDVYTDILSGGFSVMKMSTDYLHPMSFDQKIVLGRVYDPTLCGFDKMAVTSHKGDGQYCFELFPKTREEFENDYGSKVTSKMRFVKEMEGFNWSYSTGTKDILLMAHYYEKKKKKEKIVQLLNGKVMTVKQYEQFIEWWNSQTDIIQQAPAVKGKARTTEITSICRYTVVENEILEYTETDWQYLPLIFVAGNSVTIRETNSDSAKQLTRPYVYHAMGIQRLKNFAGINLANELENMMQSKLMAPVEAINPQYSEGFTNFQKATTILYNPFKNNDPNIPIPKPEVIQRVPAPPEITNTFTLSDEMTQAILGTYDSSLGVQSNQLSGVAIVEGATQSNATAMPYIVGFLKALNRVGEIIIDLIPKYYTGQRSLTVMDINRKPNQMTVNQPGGISTNYDPNMMQVKVEAGVNFEIQKARAVETMVSLAQAVPIFAQFLGSKAGMKALLENIDIKGIDGLKPEVDQFMDKQEQMQQQQQQMAMQMNPIVVKQQELQMKDKQNQVQNSLDAARIGLEEQKQDTDRMTALANIGQASDKHALESARVVAEQNRTAVEAAVNMADIHHSHNMDKANFHFEKQRANKQEM